ncbi:MAG: hypothetical protein K2Y42_20950 [Hyphomicrobium sp.]|uniref:hypothetical protein n=1 Tax=Hyphomicrobium sp. TaxID=82 RepID=UPI0025C0F32D|nr:hypothetical protein [Hyphomicrobium sp.]MBX9865219.1 hypothetical protein [Hyphomicrobium sp.]
MEKLALRRLTASDLSFFETHFQSKRYGDHRQKGINLDVAIFVNQLYPSAPKLMPAKHPVLVTFFGSGAIPAWSPPSNLRPIIYNNGKNWRLNGGTIPDDPSHPLRFEQLQPGDLALLRFRGAPLPLEVDVFLFAASEPVDFAAAAIWTNAEAAAAFKSAVADLNIPHARSRKHPTSGAEAAAVRSRTAMGLAFPGESVYIGTQYKEFRHG